jgi:hypothetical protein
LGNQLRSLQTLSAPWDTGLHSITVNNAEYDLGSTIYLPAGTREVNVEASTNEYDARAVVSNAGVLKDGLNNLSVLVTSANGKHTRTEPVKVYVYAKLTTKSSVLFSKSVSKITSKGTSSLNSLITKLTASQKLVVTVSMPKVKTFSTSKNNILLKQRTDQVLKLLASKQIKPIKVTKILSSLGSPDSLTISTTYVK